MVTDQMAVAEHTATINQLLSVLPDLKFSQPAPAPAPCPSWSEWTSVLQELHSYSEALGLPLFGVETFSGRIVGSSCSDCLTFIPHDVLAQLGESPTPRVWPQSSDLTYVTIPLSSGMDLPLVAVGCVLGHSAARPHDLVLAAAEQNWSQAQLNDWLNQLPACDARTLDRLLKAVLRQVAEAEQQQARQHDLDGLASQVEYSYEEICLLHTLTQNLQISKAPSELARLALNRLQGVVAAEGHAVWLNDKRSATQFLIQGEVPFGAERMLKLVSRFDQHDWSRPLVKNHVWESGLAAEFPGLRNFVLTPVAEGKYRCGWLCSCNTINNEEYGTVQANLLASIGTILGTHTRNSDLYQQHEELLVGFVRSLVSSLDAKDPYTRGHSERVALIARRLGQQLSLPDEDLKQIYLSGLLHDIGKIGVDDQILRKATQLTPAEFEQIKKHPMIGYQILAGLKNLQPVIPGVRHHHESWNGKGYPDGLQGEDIPLMARILAVADSYDAMGSNRPYRDGMNLDVLENIFRHGVGAQWDPRVIEAYFAARHDIRDICENHGRESSAPLTLLSPGTDWLPQSVFSRS